MWIFLTQRRYLFQKNVVFFNLNQRGFSKSCWKFNPTKMMFSIFLKFKPTGFLHILLRIWFKMSFFILIECGSLE